MRISALLHRRRPTTEGPRVTLVPEQYAGRTGVSVYEDGRKVAWGANETAAVCAYQVGRAA